MSRKRSFRNGLTGGIVGGLLVAAAVFAGSVAREAIQAWTMTRLLSTLSAGGQRDAPALPEGVETVLVCPGLAGRPLAGEATDL